MHDDIEIKNLNKSFAISVTGATGNAAGIIKKHRTEKKYVLKNLNTVIPAGKVTAIMGESGSGKTTLLNILLGLLKKDSGEITGVPDKKAAVFQEDRLFENFTSLENVLAVCQDEERIKKCFAELLIPEAYAEAVSKLSGGQKRRVAIARAILSDYELLILDEPFKGLDEATRKVVAEEILKYNAGRTVIMVTHDTYEAELMGAGILI